MSTTATPAQAAREELSGTFKGQLIGPEDLDYDEARKLYNAMIDKRPALIASCRNTADVVAAVIAAREADLEISVRGGGHNVAGTAVSEGGVVLDLGAMRNVSVDVDRMTVRAGGGARLGRARLR